MSRDFSPQQCWIANETTKSKISPFGIYLENFKEVTRDSERLWYTEEELSDRRKYEYLAVCGSDIYSEIKKVLTRDQFESLNHMLGSLIEADFGEKETSKFPRWLTDWYFNRIGSYYREPNNEMFLQRLKENMEAGT